MQIFLGDDIPVVRVKDEKKMHSDLLESMEVYRWFSYEGGELAYKTTKDGGKTCKSLVVARDGEEIETALYCDGDYYAYSYYKNGVSMFMKNTIIDDLNDHREYTIVDADTLREATEKAIIEKYNVGNISEEIDEKTYCDMLDVLPPLRFTSDGFFMSEFSYGSITRQYIRYGDRFFWAEVDFKDRSTWINLEKIKEFINK
jgi:hypothetical protein